MQLHTLKRQHPNKEKVRVGRGGKRGKTSGRGTKGQKARAGRKIRPEVRDMIKKIPKRRGFGKNRARTVHSGRVQAHVVNLSLLEKLFASGDAVTRNTLLEKGVVSGKHSRKTIKVLGDGALTKKLTLSGLSVSAGAKTKIEAAGGQVQ